MDSEENINVGELLSELTSNDIVCFKYKSIVSVDVKRSFSMYKTLPTDNRRKFKFENLAKYLILQCNVQDKYVKLRYFNIFILKDQFIISDK